MPVETYTLTSDMWIAIGTLLCVYLLIFSDVMHRTSAGIIGAVVMVGVGSVFGFYSQEAAVASIDANTLLLLLAMMLLVAMLRQTGGLEYIGIRLAKFAQGDPRWLLVYLCLAVTVFSMFLDNVTTVLIFAPLTVLITRLLRFNPAPFLIAEAMLSNVGGAATLVGDPPNIMIGSAAGLDFTAFITHMMPMILPAWFGTLLLIMFLFRNELQPVNCKDHCMDLDETKAIKDKAGLWRISLVLVVVVLLFFVHHHLHLFPAYVAWIGLAMALLITRPDPESLFSHVIWSVLLFFAALFIIVGGVEATGLFELIGRDPDSLLWTALILMWAAALLSALVDNIPFTVAMIPVIAGLEVQGVNTQPLWWALALGVGLGGNATHIGATANIICIAEANKSQHPDANITPMKWMRIGFPVLFFSLTMASCLFALMFEWIAQ